MLIQNIRNPIPRAITTSNASLYSPILHPFIIGSHTRYSSPTLYYLPCLPSSYCMSLISNEFPSFARLDYPVGLPLLHIFAYDR